MRFLTYNTALLWLPEWLQRRAGTPPHVQARQAGLPRALRAIDADVVALQEVFGNARRSEIKAALKDSYPYAAESPSHSWPVFDAGLLILSKYPLANPCFEPFRDGPWEETLFCRRGLVSAVLPSGPSLFAVGELMVVTFHTAAGRDPESRRIENFRAKQIDEILQHATRDPKRPTVLLGDLNAGFGVDRNAGGKSVGISRWNYDQVINFRRPDSADGEFVNLLDLCRGGRSESELVTWDSQGVLSAAGIHNFQLPQRIDHVFVNRAALTRISMVQVETVLSEPIVPVGNGGAVPISDHVGVLATLG